jgi:acyl-ACP thioesterase
VFTHSYTIRAAEVGPSGAASPLVLLDLFQDIAGLHADRLGWSMQALLDRGEAWLMAQIAFERLEAPLPQTGEQVAFETWPSGADRLYAYRDARLRTEQGELAHVVSRWFVLDLETRRPRRIGDEFSGVVDRSRPPALELPRLRWTAEAPDHTADLRVARRDLDLNGHANNVAFARWALESVPADLADSAELHRLDYAVRREALWAERITSETVRQAEPDTLLHRITRGGDELALARSRWRSA